LVCGRKRLAALLTANRTEHTLDRAAVIREVDAQHQQHSTRLAAVNTQTAPLGLVFGRLDNASSPFPKLLAAIFRIPLLRDGLRRVAT